MVDKKKERKKERKKEGKKERKKKRKKERKKRGDPHWWSGLSRRQGIRRVEDQILLSLKNSF